MRRHEARRIRYQAWAGDAVLSAETTTWSSASARRSGVKLFQTVGGHPLSEVLGVMTEAIAARGLKPRVVRFKPHGGHILPRSFRRAPRRLAASASGCRPRARRSSISATACRTTISSCFPTRRSPGSSIIAQLGANAAAYALGEMPEPVVVPTRGEAMGSRYHARVAMIYAIETALTAKGATAAGDRG